MHKPGNLWTRVVGIVAVTGALLAAGTVSSLAAGSPPVSNNFAEATIAVTSVVEGEQVAPTPVGCSGDAVVLLCSDVDPADPTAASITQACAPAGCVFVDNQRYGDAVFSCVLSVLFVCAYYVPESHGGPFVCGWSNFAAECVIVRSPGAGGPSVCAINTNLCVDPANPPSGVPDPDPPTGACVSTPFIVVYVRGCALASPPSAYVFAAGPSPTAEYTLVEGYLTPSGGRVTAGQAGFDDCDQSGYAVTLDSDDPVNGSSVEPYEYTCP